MTEHPRILYVAREWPCPPRQGSHLRILHIGRQLRQMGEVTFVYAGPDGDSPYRPITEAEFESVVVIPTVVRKWPGILDRVRYKIAFHWPWHYGDSVHPKGREQFDDLCKQSDLVWFHTLGSSDAFGQKGYLHSVIDLDDLNQLKFAGMGRAINTLRSRIANHLLTFKWRKRECQAIYRFSRIAVCSNEDRMLLGKTDQIAIIPNGFERPSVKPTWKDRDQNRLGFIGLLGYAPNYHGMRWFADQVWPIIRRQIPSAELRLVGHHDPKYDFSTVPGFQHTGFLSDPSEEFASWSSLIVPIQFGGGTRIKILEAFSRMCPVITTPAGSYGLEVEKDRHLLIRQSPSDFARACIELLQNPAKGKSLALSGWSLFESKYDWDRISPAIREIAESAINS